MREVFYHFIYEIVKNVIEIRKEKIRGKGKQNEMEVEVIKEVMRKYGVNEK